MVGDGLNSPRYQGGKAAALGIGDGGPLLPDKYEMKRSQMLNLKDEKLGTINDSLFEEAFNSAVENANLEGNMLTEMPSGLHLMATHLKELQLTKNKITEIPTFINKFSVLTTIDLSCNLLCSLPDEFGGLQTLTDLNISYNRFADFPAIIYQLLCLRKLKANDNHLKSIDASDAGLGALRQLTKLDLSNNDITNIPPVLGNMTNINDLKLTGNPFRQPRTQILCLGTEAVLKYLRDRIPN